MLQRLRRGTSNASASSSGSSERASSVSSAPTSVTYDEYFGRAGDGWDHALTTTALKNAVKASFDPKTANKALKQFEVLDPALLSSRRVFVAKIHALIYAESRDAKEYSEALRGAREMAPLVLERAIKMHEPAIVEVALLSLRFVPGDLREFVYMAARENEVACLRLLVKHGFPIADPDESGNYLVELLSWNPTADAEKRWAFIQAVIQLGGTVNLSLEARDQLSHIMQVYWPDKSLAIMTMADALCGSAADVFQRRASLIAKQAEEGKHSQRLGLKQMPNGAIFAGEMRGGIPYGLGRTRLQGGKIFEGQHIGHWFHGFGVGTTSSGERQAGRHHYNRLTGPASYRWSNGQVLHGTFEDGKAVGDFCVRFIDGREERGRLSRNSTGYRIETMFSRIPSSRWSADTNSVIGPLVFAGPNSPSDASSRSATPKPSHGSSPVTSLPSTPRMLTERPLTPLLPPMSPGLQVGFADVPFPEQREAHAFVRPLRVRTRPSLNALTTTYPAQDESSVSGLIPLMLGTVNEGSTMAGLPALEVPPSLTEQGTCQDFENAIAQQHARLQRLPRY